tara:strand:+ start:367 stop:2445 length:2079 start_codon:yes stop_codon:yes gene_type:complete
METEKEVQEFDRDSPDVDFLKSDLNRCRNNLSYWQSKAESARESRRNEWPGKGTNGQKEGPDAFPWKGSSDLEANLINPLIDGDVALLTGSLNKGNLLASPIESGDITTAKTVTDFMRWRLDSMSELPREAGVAANLLLEQGIAFLGVYWKREIKRIYKPISIAEIEQQAPEVAAAILDPDMKETVVEMLQGVFPKLRKGRITRMVNELRKDGVTEIPSEKVTANRPSVKAYELGRDLIVDSNVLDLQNARAVYCVHYLTPEQAKEMETTANWDSDFVDDVIENTQGAFPAQGTEVYNTYVTGGYGSLDQYEGLIRLITCYRKEIDEDGVPICTTTIFSESVEGYAKYTTEMYGDGYPFVAITREHLSRRLFDSRGYPELLRSYQLAVKTEMDARRDRASMSTVPPMEVLIGRKPEQIGPGSVIPVRRRGEAGFMEIPKYSPASTEVEMQLRQLADKVTGRATSELDAVEANVMRQALVNNWLHGWTQVLRQFWAMERQYGNPEQWFRVTGSEQGVQLLMDEAADDYDFRLSWNANNADEAAVVKKLETVGQVLSQFDRSGQARYDVFLQTFLEAIDPGLASKLIAPAQEATNKEIMETSEDIAKIFSGQVVNAPENANVQLRMQMLQQYLQGTEEIPASDVQERMQSDEQFAARLQNYSSQLSFQEQQRTNALTGKLGAPPGNVPASSMAG